MLHIKGQAPLIDVAESANLPKTWLHLSRSRLVSQLTSWRLVSCIVMLTQNSRIGETNAELVQSVQMRPRHPKTAVCMQATVTLVR